MRMYLSGNAENPSNPETFASWDGRSATIMLSYYEIEVRRGPQRKRFHDLLKARSKKELKKLINRRRCPECGSYGPCPH